MPLKQKYMRRLIPSWRQALEKAEEEKRILKILTKLNKERGKWYREVASIRVLATKGTPDEIAQRIIKRLNLIEK